MSTSRDLASAFAEDQAAREAASTGESSFIDAAAGTGKTTTIVARIAYHVVIEGELFWHEGEQPRIDFVPVQIDGDYPRLTGQEFEELVGRDVA